MRLTEHKPTFLHLETTRELECLDPSPGPSEKVLHLRYLLLGVIEVYTLRKIYVWDEDKAGRILIIEITYHHVRPEGCISFSRGWPRVGRSR